MAYFDENGRITIDEDAAAKDIRRLRESAQVLKDSRAAIRSLKNQAGEMQGQISSAILQKANEMEKRQTAMIDKLEETASYIQRVVDRYQKLDEEIKRAIQAAASAAEAAARAAAVSAGTAGGIRGGSGSSGGGGSTRSDNNTSSNKSNDLADKVKAAAGAAVNFLDGLF